MELYRYIHEWNRKESNLNFITIPMIHIGSKLYYQTISDILHNHHINIALIEGVPLKSKNLGNYIKLAKKLEICSQAESLQIPEKVKKINIDMDGAEFSYTKKKLPLKDKLKLKKIDFYLSRLHKVSKKDLFDSFFTNFSYPENSRMKLIDPKNHIPLKHRNKSSLDLLFENSRNDALQLRLDSFIIENVNRKKKNHVAILFGDSHMPYIYETLFNANYHWKMMQKIAVL